MMRRYFVGGLLLVSSLCAEAAESPKPIGPFVYDAKGHRDPFIPLVRDGKLIGTQQGKSIEGSRPVLYGILWDPNGQSMAMINDTEVRAGETVGMYQVLEIRKDAVVLSAGGDPLVLQLEFETPLKDSHEPKGR